MKKIGMMIIALVAICGSVFATLTDQEIWENGSQNLKIINVFDLKDNEMNEIFLGKHPEIAIVFPAQTILPVSFFLKGDLVSLVEDENLKTVEVMQTFYARCVNKEIILSTDLRDWKPFIEFITGNLSASLSIQEGKPSFIIGVEANQYINLIKL